MPASPSVVHVPEPLVCVIDADASTRAGVSALLHRLGATVRSYDCASGFLGSLGETGPACLIAEATMPDMNGIELMQELKRRGFDIPTILLARHEDVPFAVAAMHAGAVDIVEKPYIDRALMQHVGLLLTPDQR